MTPLTLTPRVFLAWGCKARLFAPQSVGFSPVLIPSPQALCCGMPGSGPGVPPPPPGSVGFGIWGLSPSRGPARGSLSARLFDSWRVNNACTYLSTYLVPGSTPWNCLIIAFGACVMHWVRQTDVPSTLVENPHPGSSFQLSRLFPFFLSFFFFNISFALSNACYLVTGKDPDSNPDSTWVRCWVSWMFISETLEYVSVWLT